MLSVNLLPPQYKKEVELSKDNRKKLSKIFISTVILVFVLALSGGSYLYFNQIVREKTDAISKLDPQINDLGKTEKKFTSLQGRIELLKTLVNDHLYWNDLYETIYASLPTDVKFNQIILNSDLKKSQQITGISPDLATPTIQMIRAIALKLILNYLKKLLPCKRRGIDDRQLPE